VKLTPIPATKHHPKPTTTQTFSDHQNAVPRNCFYGKFYVQYSVHHGSIYQEITNRCHVTVRPHDTVTVPEVAYAVNFIDLLMMDTECVRNM
jgi:hypothetical protein